MEVRLTTLSGSLVAASLMLMATAPRPVPLFPGQGHHHTGGRVGDISK
jgi:hypothetical protein